MKYNFNFLILSLIFAFLSVSLAFGADKVSEPVVVQPSSDGVQRLNVTVDSYSFSPNHIIVSENKPVELTLKSVTKIVPHNFTLKDPEGGLNVDENISPGKRSKSALLLQRAEVISSTVAKRACLQITERREWKALSRSGNKSHKLRSRGRSCTCSTHFGQLQGSPLQRQ